MSGVKYDIGIKFDEGKLRYDLVPPEALAELVKTYMIGADKYQDWNWAKGFNWSRIYAALIRHIEAWRKGQDIDPENGQYHLSAVAWCALTLLQYNFMRQEINDDRPCWVNEEWKVIPDWETYEVSSCGRIRKNGNLLKPSIDRGYYRIWLWKNNKSVMKYIHRLVAKLFLADEDFQEDFVVNHRDGDRGNNNWTNLEFLDQSGNILDSYRRGSRICKLHDAKDNRNAKATP